MKLNGLSVILPKDMMSSPPFQFREAILHSSKENRKKMFCTKKLSEPNNKLPNMFCTESKEPMHHY